jgi:hypothetical protein
MDSCPFRTLAVVVVLALAACSPASTGDGGTTGGGSATGGGETTGGGTATGGGNQPDACVPLTCATANATCGMVPDGCGAMLDCGACTCTATTFATDCPSRPCEVATGCTNNACTYGPVTCGFTQCVSCLATGADGGCADADLRGCGPGCATSYCDPKPSMASGAPVYGNACLAVAEVKCGPCGLGGLACGADGGLASCDAITIPGVNPALIECNGGSSAATVLYVDPASNVSAVKDGSQTAPFLTLTDAFTAAAARGSRAIIVGGAPTFTAPLVVVNGVSIIGGFTGAPYWVRDPSRRPVFSVAASGIVNGALVGVSADAITVDTVLSNLDVVVPSISASPSAEGASTIGARLTDAARLTLENVHLTVGAAQAGAPGATGATATGSVMAPWPGAPGNQSFGTCVYGPAGTAGVSFAPTCNGVVDNLAMGGLGCPPWEAANNNAWWGLGYDAPAGTKGGWGYTGAGAGATGAAWPAPTAAADGVSSLTWLSNAPVPEGRGATGSAGKNGPGGGGGGSGYSQSPGNTCLISSGGGGGGAGGCGGLGGAGGLQGGWAIGVVVSGSSAATLSNLVVTVGAGGAGGVGGSGSPGLPGSPGAAAGPAMAWPNSAGFKGGDGAPGQNGANGGAGASGQARGVLCAPGAMTPTSSVSATGPTVGFQAVDGC